MPNATITTTTLVGPWTRTQFVDAMKSAMIAAGWTLESETSPASTPYNLTWARTYNASTYGTTRLNLSITNAAGTNMTVNARWNSSFTGSSSHTAVVATGDMTFTAVNHPEISGIIWRQGATINSQLIVRPKYKPAEVNENTHIWGMFALSTGATGPIIGPQGSGLVNAGWRRAITNINSANPLTGNHDIIPLLGIINSDWWGGLCSSDVVTACYPSGFGMGDTLQDAVSGKQFFVVHNGIAVITSGSTEV